jgi:hypothetical protein
VEERLRSVPYIPKMIGMEQEIGSTTVLAPEFAILNIVQQSTVADRTLDFYIIQQ